MFGNSKKWKVLELAGHPIYVTPFFLGLIALFSLGGLRAGGGMGALSQVLIWAPVLFIGILFHELGHAFALQGFGYGNSKIVLHGFGGVTINERRTNSPPGKSILISLAGPGASLLLGLIFGGLLAVYAGFKAATTGFFEQKGLLVQFLQTMAFINIFWAIFNLIPINPMDGGHVVLHALRAFFKDQRKAIEYSAKSSLVLLALLIPASFLLFQGGGLLWLLVLGGLFGFQNWQMLKAAQSGRRRGPRGF